MFSVALLIASGLLGSPLEGRGGDPVEATYRVDLVGRSRATFALPPGPRTIDAVRWEPADGPADSWRSVRIRLVWDGDDPERAGIDLPLGRLVERGGQGGGPPPSFVNRRAMPYRRSARLVLDADGPVRGAIVFSTTPADPDRLDRGYLRAVVPPRDDDRTQPDAPDRGGIRENQGGAAPPAVRYWYDRSPGPSSTGGRG